MAVGDDAQAAGYPLVPDTGELGRIRWGAQEINRTRDLIALVRAMIPTNGGGWRHMAGISIGTGPPPTSGTIFWGDIYIQY